MVMLVITQFIVLWSMVSRDCRKLMIECIMFTCVSILAFAIYVGGVCDS